MRKLFFLALMSSALGVNAQPADTLQLHAESTLHTAAMMTESDTGPYYTIADRMKALKVNGLSIAVVEQGKIAWAKGYGMCDASVPATRVDTTTLFQCASIGKVVTALAALHLVQQGKISLDEPVNAKLRNWKLPAAKGWEEQVTLRHLLSHSAGLDDNYGFDGYQPHAQLPELRQVLDGIAPANNRKKLKVKTKPGTAEQYSGGGYIIIQQLVEELSGQPFAQYVDAQIFKPLHMTHSTYDYYPDETLKAPVARGHDEKGAIEPKFKYRVYPEMAAAGFWTTPSDLARLVIGMQQAFDGLNTAVVDSSLLRVMLKPQINTTGLGVHLKGYKDVSVFWHSGNNAGYTGLLFGTLRGQGAVVLTNSDDGVTLAQECIRSIADTYNWPAMQVLHLKSLPVADYDLLTGIYGTDEKTATVIGKTEKGLYLQPPGSRQRLDLYRLTDGSFIIREKPDHVRVYFDSDADGKVNTLRFEQNCGAQTGTLKRL